MRQTSLVMVICIGHYIWHVGKAEWKWSSIYLPYHKSYSLSMSVVVLVVVGVPLSWHVGMGALVSAGTAPKRTFHPHAPPPPQQQIFHPLLTRKENELEHWVPCHILFPRVHGWQHCCREDHTHHCNATTNWWQPLHTWQQNGDWCEDPDSGDLPLTMLRVSTHACSSCLSLGLFS